jgi:predicted small secreted protein
MRRQLGSVFAVILAIATVAAMAISIQGCNTDQSPRTQIKDRKSVV